MAASAAVDSLLVWLMDRGPPMEFVNRCGGKELELVLEKRLGKLFVRVVVAAVRLWRGCCCEVVLLFMLMLLVTLLLRVLLNGSGCLEIGIFGCCGCCCCCCCELFILGGAISEETEKEWAVME